MTISKPRKMGKGRPKDWSVMLSNGKNRVERTFETEKKANDQIRIWKKAQKLGRFQIEFPEISRKLNLSAEQRETGAVRWMTAQAVYLDRLGPDRNLRVATIKGYEGNLRRCGEFLGNPPIMDVTKQDLSRFIVTKGRTEKSRESLRGTVSAFMKWCSKQGYCSREISREIDWEKIREDEANPDYLAVDEVQRLFEFAVVMKAGYNHASAQIDVEKTLRFRAALGCALFLGIRPGLSVKGYPRAGELPLIQRGDFDLQERSLVIRSSASKTRVVRRIYDVPANLLEAVGIAGYRDSDYILPGGYGWFRVHLNLTRKRIEKEGLPALTWCQKILRHTFASYGIHRGISREWVTQAGGWQDQRILSKHYDGAATPEDAAEFWALQFADIPARWKTPLVKKEIKKVARGFALLKKKLNRRPFTEYVTETCLAELAELVESTGKSRAVVLERAVKEYKERLL